MTLAELKKLLDATGFPVAYSHFKKSVATPYICYHVTYSPNFIADNKTYHKIDAIDIELYTDKKDLQAESVLETLLDATDIPYRPIETFIESEKLHQRIYEMRLF